MKTFVTGFIIVLTLVVIAGIAIVFFHRSSTPTVPLQDGSLPIVDGQMTAATGTDATSDTLSLAGTSGAVIVAQNFLASPTTVGDTANPGYYYLGYHLPMSPSDTTGDVSAPYVIEYIATTNYFGISLLQEPIGESRHRAEQYLLASLGVSESQACTLKYMVSVPDSVNSLYSGQNLGFSFCSGAVQLPQ